MWFQSEILSWYQEEIKNIDKLENDLGIDYIWWKMVKTDKDGF